MESVVKVQRAALRAPRGQMLGGGPQAMSMCIVEGRQQRRWPRAAATRRELSRATFAEPTYPRDTVLTIEYAQPHGSCWALPSSVWRGLHGPECWALPSFVWQRLHGPECGLRFRCSSSTMRTDIAFLLLGSSDVRTAAVARPSSRLAYHGVPGQPLGNEYAMRPRLTSTARSGSSLAPERCASIPMRATPRSFEHPARVPGLSS